MLMEKERELVVEFGKQMSAAGLSRSTSGNISACDREQGLMAISPSGMDYFDTKPEDVVVLDLNGHIVDGNRKPSSEWAMHTAFYVAKPHIAGVVHTHSIFCTTFAALGMPIKSVHYVMGDANATEVPCAPYQTYGTPEIAKGAVEACGDGDAVLLGNHGLITVGKSLKSAFALARNMEFVAEVQYRAMCIGKPIVLDDEEMHNVMRRFSTYGQNAQKSAEEQK